MRRSDLLMLALSSLLGRKVRTALSVLGVAVGGFALVASLAIGQGVEATLLDHVARRGATLVLVTHDEELAQRHTTRIVRMRDGRIEEG